jgi:hypothetical protein
MDRLSSGGKEIRMKSSPRQNRLWLFLVVGGVSVLGAFALLAQPDRGDLAPADQAASGGGGSVLMGVPVGAILPYVGSLDSLPQGWLPCDGRTVSDTNSPFHGKAIPNLMDNRFVMGVTSADELNTTGGGNEIVMDGQHNHRGSATNRVAQVSGTPRYLDSSGNRGFRHTHDLQINVNGNHNHGGEGRPQFYGTYFIIRVK